MDRLIQLEQSKQQPARQPVTGVEDDDVADFYHYIPRRRGDFPPVAYELPDNPPTAIRYQIVDRVFVDDIPIYTLRPHSAFEEQETIRLQRPQGTDDPSRPGNGGEKWAALPGGPDGIRSTSSRELSSSDENDDTLLRIGLSEIESYVTPRELERYESYRFQHPRPEDFPVAASISRASSIYERDRRAQERTESTVTKPRGRPPTKKSRLGPSVVIYSSSVEALAEGGMPETGSRQAVEILSDMSSTGSDVDMKDDGKVTSLIEQITQKVDVLGKTNSLRDASGTLNPDRKELTSRPRRESHSPRSISRPAQPSCTEQQSLHESFAHKTCSNERNRQPKARAREFGAPSLISPTNVVMMKSPKSQKPNGIHNFKQSIASSLPNPKPTTQSTIDTYMKAMSKAKQARNLSSTTSRPRSPRKQSKQHPIANGKQWASAIGVQNALGVEDESHIDSDEDYEISHIVFHDDSRGKRYYLVAWKGYDVEDATWLTEDELGDAEEAVGEYLLSLVVKDGDGTPIL